MNVFDGRRTVAFAVDTNVKAQDKRFAEKFFENHNFGIIEVVNHPHLRETVSFLKLLNHVRSKDPKEITFYAHTKGTTRTDDKLFAAVTLWAECLYKYNLSNIELIEEILERYPTVGVFKRFGKFPHFPKKSTWHYSGTFFWFRNDAIFTKEWQDALVETRYGVEAFLSLLFDKKEGASIYPWGIGNLYNYPYMRKVAKQLERNRIAVP